MALAERRWLCDVLSSRGLTARGVIVADDDNLDLADEYGFDRLEFPNDRGLGAKFNAGYRYALDRGADYIVHVGSDDWVHPDFFDPLPIPDVHPDKFPSFEPGRCVVQKPGPVILAGMRIGLVHLPSGRGCVFHMKRTWGVIPWAIPRSAFRDNPEPVKPDIQRGVEFELIRGIAPVNYQYHDPHPFLGVDFKSDVNVTPWEGLEAHGTPLPDVWGALAEHYPAPLVEAARAYRSEVPA